MSQIFLIFYEKITIFKVIGISSQFSTADQFPYGWKFVSRTGIKY